MAHPSMHSGSYLGAGHHGQYRNALTQAQGITNQASAAAHQGNAALAAAAQYAALAFPERPIAPIEDAGIRAGEIIGYRAWMYRRGLLWSMAAPYCWLPGEVVTGDPDKGLGVHAFKSLGDAVGQYGLHDMRHERVAFGSVALWGVVIEHELGWRAEFGAIENITVMALDDPRPSRWKFWRKPHDTLATIRRTYGLQQ